MQRRNRADCGATADTPRGIILSCFGLVIRAKDMWPKASLDLTIRSSLGAGG